MKLATEALSKKSRTPLRMSMRSLGSILERSIVGEGSCFFEFFPLALGCVLAMMTVIPGEFSAALLLVIRFDQMKGELPRNNYGMRSCLYCSATYCATRSSLTVAATRRSNRGCLSWVLQFRYSLLYERRWHHCFVLDRKHFQLGSRMQFLRASGC
jgi:hypothetical protein